ncbi:MAG: DUF31 family protein [Mycoplasmataceae bacterium]|nr:DUF31 family protein [Mycoplasmataceae bacterium]
MVKSLCLISGAIISSFGGISNGIQIPNATSVSMTPDEANDFIYQRTFSLRGGGYGGTGWLLKHITGESNNYKYYLMTNWHVSNVMPSNISFGYATTNAVDTAVTMQYSSLIAGDANWNNASYWSEDGILFGVDASLIEVDFTARTTTDANLKTRLDALNTYGASGGHNNFLFNSFSNYNDLNISTAFYTGGYPGANWNGDRYPNNLAYWESGSDIINEKWNYFDSKTKNHSIDTNDEIFSISNAYVTPIYNLPDNGPLYKLGGGASGSMMIDENGNLLGLYWGGFKNTANTQYKCAFETFTWGDHNLFNDYLNSKWISTAVTKNWWGIIIVGIACACAIGIGTTIYLIKKSKSAKN